MDELLQNEFNTQMPSLPNSNVNTTTVSDKNTEVNTNNDMDNGEEKSVIISDDMWKRRLQDKGCAIDELASKNYRGTKIPPVGPKDNELYYPEIAAIAIDFLKSFYEQKEIGEGWQKLPSNKTNVKIKIIELVLSRRRQNARLN